MKRTLIISGLMALLLSCKSTEVEPGEVAATVTGAVIADYFTKGCSGGGLEIKIGSAVYTVSNSVPATYEEPNSWPIAVWIRYQPDIPDACTQSTNRVKILSNRKMQ